MPFPLSRILVIAALATLAASSVARGQEPAETSAETLTLERAVELALRDNRTVRSSAIEIDKAGDRLAAGRTKRFPAFNLYLLGAQNLTPIDFTFAKGTFGTFPEIGPVPAEDTKISTPRQPTMTIMTQVQQPLSQLYRIGLNEKLLRLDIDLAREDTRSKASDVVASVKEAYYGLLQTQSSLDSTNESIRMYAELDRVTDDYIIKEVVLRSDSLDVKARLAKAEYDASTLEDRLASQKEQLNILLGRDVDTPFRVSAIPEYTRFDADLTAARTRAIERRPEVREARLKAEQAGIDRKMKKAELIPDVSATFTHVTLVNYDSLLPRQVASAGVVVNWEIFDWGRKRSELREKDRALDQADIAVRDATARVTAEVDDKFRTLGQTQRLIRVTRLRVEACREDVRVTTARYKAQVALLKDALEAQTALADADREYEQALLSFWTAKADFEKAMGGDRP